MQGNFSLPSLRALLDSGIEVCAVVLPASRRPGLDQPAITRREQPHPARPVLPVLNSSLHTNLAQFAWERQIPLWEVSRMSDPKTVSALAAYQADVICVACFSQRIAPSILDIPRFGCLIVTQSLLPDLRAPVPWFWAIRQAFTIL